MRHVATCTAVSAAKGNHPNPCAFPGFWCSEEEADAAHRRIQRLRAFHYGASQFVAALQAFLHARTAGGCL